MYKGVEKLNSKHFSFIAGRERTAAPLQWPLGQVISGQPGNDGLVRTATMRTAKGIFSRAITRLAVVLDSSKVEF